MTSALSAVLVELFSVVYSLNTTQRLIVCTSSCFIPLLIYCQHY